MAAHRRCLNCGEWIKPNNTTGYCTRYRACLRTGQYVQQVRRHAAARAARPRCKLCGGPVSKRAKHGICNRTPACRRAAQQAVAAEALARVRAERTPPRTCRTCGRPITATNRFGQCKRGPECSSIYSRLASAAHRAAIHTPAPADGAAAVAPHLAPPPSFPRKRESSSVGPPCPTSAVGATGGLSASARPSGAATSDGAAAPRTTSGSHAPARRPQRDAAAAAPNWRAMAFSKASRSQPPNPAPRLAAPPATADDDLLGQVRGLLELADGRLSMAALRAATGAPYGALRRVVARLTAVDGIDLVGADFRADALTNDDLDECDLVLEGGARV